MLSSYETTSQLEVARNAVGQMSACPRGPHANGTASFAPGSEYLLKHSWHSAGTYRCFDAFWDPFIFLQPVSYSNSEGFKPGEKVAASASNCSSD